MDDHSPSTTTRKRPRREKDKRRGRHESMSQQRRFAALPDVNRRQRSAEVFRATLPDMRKIRGFSHVLISSRMTLQTGLDVIK